MRNGEFLRTGEVGERRLRFVGKENGVVTEAAGSVALGEDGTVGVGFEGDFGACDVFGGQRWRIGDWGIVGGICRVKDGFASQFWRVEQGLEVVFFDDDEA